MHPPDVAYHHQVSLFFSILPKNVSSSWVWQVSSGAGQKSRWSKADVGLRDVRGWEEATQAAGKGAPPTGCWGLGEGGGVEGVCLEFIRPGFRQGLISEQWITLQTRLYVD